MDFVHNMTSDRQTDRQTDRQADRQAGRLAQKPLNLKQKKAFTLAETLITLTIIGVVAALGIPSLMNNIQDKQFKTAAKKAYSKCSEVITLMRQEEGGDLSYYISHAWTFKPVFIKYFNVLKDCGNADDCVEQNSASDIYTSLYGDKAATTYGGEGQFITTDGMFFNIQNGTSPGLDITIIVDVNGYEKKPNIYGRDTFAFQIVNNVLLPMGAKGTYINSVNYCKRDTSSNVQGLACMDKVLRGVDY